MEFKKTFFENLNFDIPSYNQWKEKAEKSLNGESLENLITYTYEGISLQPMYRQKDIRNTTLTYSYPGFSPFTRGKEVTNNGWEVNQEINIGTPNEFNKVAKYEISKGQTSLNIVIDNPTKNGFNADEFPEETGNKGLSISGVSDVVMLLKDINLTYIPIHIYAGVNSLPLFSLFIAALEKEDRKVKHLKGCFGMDPFKELITNGSIRYDLSEIYDIMTEITKWTLEYAPDLQTILVHSDPYHNGGSSAVEELAFTLSTGVEYLYALTTRGMDVNKAAPKIRFVFSIGSNCFVEIAKLRAARTLWARIVEVFGGSSNAQKMYIHARTSLWTKTVFDPYVNILRASTEAFSAVVGGANSIHVSCFDEAIQKSTSFSRRIARNTSIILKDEAKMALTTDPGGGSWYIEVLTNEIAKKSWDIFKKIESMGGILSALKRGFPQKQVNETAEKRENNLALLKDIFVGTNMYINLKEEELDIKPFDESHAIEYHVKQVKSRGGLLTIGLKNKTNIITKLVDLAKSGANLSQIARITGRKNDGILQ
ncbi:acyl-CoA mutase large subunit family protein, partial [Bacillaceae bacterium Marseille-Q3522]|nr:acyl-CoA mutase large subunit family protein [Bacillaceae bacterium Marseille-Q3522]